MCPHWWQILAQVTGDQYLHMSQIATLVVVTKMCEWKVRVLSRESGWLSLQKTSRLGAALIATSPSSMGPSTWKYLKMVLIQKLEITLSVVLKLRRAWIQTRVPVWCLYTELGSASPHVTMS